MKEIKAYVHRHRIADVVHALEMAGFRNITIIDVKGTLQAVNAKEQDYSVELGEKVITEVKLELICDDDKAPQVIEIIRDNARTGQPEAGWIYVPEISAAHPIGDH